MIDLLHLENDLTPFSSSGLLNQIKEQIKNYNGSLITGNGHYQKVAQHFGEIELSIEKTENELSSTLDISKIKNELPSEFVSYIMKGLNNFLLLYNIQNDSPHKLIIKISKIGIKHPDSKPRDFEKATYLALQSAFISH